MNSAKGHHGDAGAAIADCILPGAAYTEKQVSSDILEPGEYNFKNDFEIWRKKLKFHIKRQVFFWYFVPQDKFIFP